MKRYLALLTAAWLIFALAWAAEATADTTMYVHVRGGTYLNGRHDAAKDSAVEMRLHRGDTVAVVGVKNGWAEIEGGEAGTAWCSVEYLADYPPDEDAPVYTVVSNGRERVRRTPDGQTVGYVNNGDTVEVRFIINGWAYLGNGYVMAGYLEIDEDHADEKE